MSIAREALLRAPVTTLFILSGVGFLASSLIPSQRWAALVFLVFALPHYLIALLATALAIELKLGPYVLWVAIALVLCSDATLMATRWATDRTFRGYRL